MERVLAARVCAICCVLYDMPCAPACVSVVRVPCECPFVWRTWVRFPRLFGFANVVQVAVAAVLPEKMRARHHLHQRG